MESLKPATELKLVSRGNEFHAFTTRLLKKTRFCTSVTTPFKQFKTVTTRVFNKTVCFTGNLTRHVGRVEKL